MIRILRLSILLLIPFIFWASSYTFPEMLDPNNIKYLSAIVTILWVMCLAFFVKLDGLSNLTSLNSKNLYILDILLKNTRKKIWWVLIAGLICGVLIWVISSAGLGYDNHIIALLVGILFGVSVSYLSVIPFWFNELQSFQDNLKIREAKKTKMEMTVKKLSQFNNKVT